MAIVKAKPTSPGRRGVVQVKHSHLHKGAPFAGLIEKKSRTGGRNNTGRITHASSRWRTQKTLPRD